MPQKKLWDWDFGKAVQTPHVLDGSVSQEEVLDQGLGFWEGFTNSMCAPWICFSRKGFSSGSGILGNLYRTLCVLHGSESQEEVLVQELGFWEPHMCFKDLCPRKRGWAFGKALHPMCDP